MSLVEYAVQCISIVVAREHHEKEGAASVIMLAF